MKRNAKQDSNETVPESTDRPVLTNHPRNCWALDTLVAEVCEAEPEVKVDIDNSDVSNANLDVTFSGCSDTLISALNLVSGDPRIEHLMAGGEELADAVYVSFYANAVTKDSREPFGVNDAVVILTTDGDEGATA